MDASTDSDGSDPKLSTTVVMSIAAGAAALIAIFGSHDPTTWITAVFALLGLLPWALEVSGSRLDPRLFVAMTMLPAAAVVLLDRNPGGMFPVLIAVVRITHRRGSTAAVAVGLLGAVSLPIGLAVIQSADEVGAVYFAAGVGVAWLAGAMLYCQDQLVAELFRASERQRAHAAVEERTRIAREVHDVIAHSLTVTILHVAGARRALTNHPERAAEALERAEDVGRESLDSIRQVVGLLRHADTASNASPRIDDLALPQISDLVPLIDQYREAGLHIDPSIELDGICPGVLTSLTVFRLVQEAMTNALQHAPGAPVSLHLHADDHRSTIRITVENPMPTGMPLRHRAQQGLGLTGMTERVRSAGGFLEAGPTEGGTWRIMAELPLTLVKEPL